MNSLLLFAQQRRGQQDMPEIDEGMLIAMGVVYVLFIIVMVGAQLVGLWKVFEKAGEPGWAAIVPFYNLMVMFRISGMSEMWILGCFVPCLNLYPFFMVHIKLAEKFGKDLGFGVGMAFLPYVFLPILGFGDARYEDSLTLLDDE